MSCSFFVSTCERACAFYHHAGFRFDHAITDPPYLEYVQNRMYSTRETRAERVEAGFEPLQDTEHVRQILPLIKRWSLFFCDLESLGLYRDAAPDRYVRGALYVKNRPQPQLSKDRPGSAAEAIPVFHSADVKKRWNAASRHNIFRATPENRKDAQHPTAKPRLLALQLVEAFTDPGDTVFDPFCGGGNIGIACHLLGRTYVGVDKNPEHVKTAEMRYLTQDYGKLAKAWAKFKATNEEEISDE